MTKPLITLKKIVHGQEVEVKIYMPVGPTKKDRQVVK